MKNTLCNFLLGRNGRKKCEQEKTESILGESTPWGKLQLVIPETVQNQMSQEGIWLKDIQQVIYHVTRTNEYVFDVISGCCAAYLQQKYATFWVTYTQSGELFEIHSVYFHRMQIVKEEL